MRWRRPVAGTAACLLVATVLVVVASRPLRDSTPFVVKPVAADTHDDVAPHIERWDGLDGWSATGVSVADGRLYGTGPTRAGAFRGLSEGSGSELFLRGSLSLVPGGGVGTTAIGVSLAEPGASPSERALIGIGFDARGHPVAYRGAEAGGTGLTVLDGAIAPAGRYWVTVVADETGTGLVMTDGAGAREWRSWIPAEELGAPISSVSVWNSDARGRAGSSIGAIGYRQSRVPLPPTTGFDAPAVTWRPGAGTAQHIALPAGYDPGEPVRLVVVAHGSGDQELAVLEPGMVEVYTALLEAGYAVASSAQHGNNWGNGVSVADIRKLYEYVDARYPVESVFLLAESMGGLSSLRAATEPGLPVAAWAGIYPVTSLHAVWRGGGQYQAAIQAAFHISSGEEYHARTAGADPTLMAPEAFAGLPMRFYASPADTLVPERTHSRRLAQRVAGHALEAVVVPHAGEHGHTSAFMPVDLVRFFDRHG